MSNQIIFSDEELTAYLDGEADYARIDMINKALAHDSELCARLEHLSLNKGDMLAAFDALLGNAPELKSLKPDLTSDADSVPLFRSFMSLAAAVILSFFVGWGVNDYMAPTPHSGWKQYAAAYQALYVNSTLAHIESNDTDKDSELKRISLALGKVIQLTDINDHEQLEYKRAQVLGFQGKPLIQLAFLSSMDTPIALCIMRSEDGGNTAIELADMEGMSSAAWEKDGYAYLLIGGRDTHLIRGVAEQFAQVL